MIKPPAPRRMTQAERSAESRGRLIRAAVKCLVTVGYAATSTHLIAKTAKMTTGRMQHQFATKADIMAAVVAAILEENEAELSPDRLRAADPAGRLREYVGQLRRVFEKESVLAAFEIRLALKGDRDMAKVVGPLIERSDQRSFLALPRLLHEIGLSDTDAGEWTGILLATLRGIALQRVASYPTVRAAIPPSPDLLLDLLLKAARP